MTLVRAHPFAKLIPNYLANCRMNIIAMRDALDRADFETVRSLGHQMSGTGAMYGFQFISDTGGAIEQAAKSSNLDASRDRVGELSNYLDGIDAIYETTGNSVFAAGPVIPRAS
jgi:HPt (histidine-containing phosphotransfer) domain-containing protein